MKTHPTILFLAMAFAVGCSSDDDAGTGALSDDPQTRQALMTADGAEIISESLRCIYSQNTGADSSLSLQLQYLESPGYVAFALYLSDPIPSAPFAVAAGQQGRFDFEVFAGGVGYRDDLVSGEVEVRLDDLPSPSSLSDGDNVVLEGVLLVNQFSLTERSATGESGAGLLNLASGSVEINCESKFRMVDVVN